MRRTSRASGATVKTSGAIARRGLSVARSIFFKKAANLLVSTPDWARCAKVASLSLFFSCRRYRPSRANSTSTCRRICTNSNPPAERVAFAIASSVVGLFDTRLTTHGDQLLPTLIRARELLSARNVLGQPGRTLDDSNHQNARLGRVPPLLCARQLTAVKLNETSRHKPPQEIR